MSASMRTAKRSSAARTGRKTRSRRSPGILAKEARLLCFDEFHVLDIADAMILSRLFKVLFEEGVVLVATSNVEPGDLYHNGLNRELFLPFIALLKRHADIFNLDARMDYRRERLKNMAIYRSPLGREADAAMDDAWISGDGA